MVGTWSVKAAGTVFPRISALGAYFSFGGQGGRNLPQFQWSGLSEKDEMAMGLWLGICRHSRRSGERGRQKVDQFLAQRRPAALLQGSEPSSSAKLQECGQVQESMRCASSIDA